MSNMAEPVRRKQAESASLSLSPATLPLSESRLTPRLLKVGGSVGPSFQKRSDVKQQRQTR